MRASELSGAPSTAAILLYHVISEAKDSSAVIAADGGSLPTLLRPYLGASPANSTRAHVQRVAHLPICENALTH